MLLANEIARIHLRSVDIIFFFTQNIFLHAFFEDLRYVKLIARVAFLTHGYYPTLLQLIKF